MPEYPEVYNVIESLKKNFIGKRIVKIDIFLEKIFPLYKHELDNLIIKDIKQVGKYILFFIDNYVLISHLRMEGKYFINNVPLNYTKHVYVVFHFNTNDTLSFYDHRQFGRFELRTINNYLATPPLINVGKNPWQISAQELYNNLRKRKILIKDALLTQKIIAGLGNIYVDEVLFKSRISPFRIACKISLEETKLIINNAKEIMDKAIALGGSSTHTFSINGVRGEYQDYLKVYGRCGQKCPNCGKIILKGKVSGRGTSYCESCQR